MSPKTNKWILRCSVLPSCGSSSPHFLLHSVKNTFFLGSPKCLLSCTIRRPSYIDVDPICQVYFLQAGTLLINIRNSAVAKVCLSRLSRIVDPFPRASGTRSRNFLEWRVGEKRGRENWTGCKRVLWVQRRKKSGMLFEDRFHVAYL
jgi:hypothetical protein